MRKLLILGSLLAATAVPAAALADVRCVNPQNNGTTGAVVGAVGGAAAGSLLAGRHSRGEGAVLGALGGAVLGDVIGSNQKRCPDGYYAYDDQRRQYYDAQGRPFTPPPPPGAYGAGYAPQPAYGQPGYGQPGPGPGPGYGPGPGDRRDGYDRGPGDRRDGYDRDRRDNPFWNGAPQGIHDRIGFLTQRVQEAASNGQIDHRTARAAYADLRDIRHQETAMRQRDGGQLNPPDRAYLQDRLDRAAGNLHMDRGGY